MFRRNSLHTRTTPKLVQRDSSAAFCDFLAPKTSVSRIMSSELFPLVSSPPRWSFKFETLTVTLCRKAVLAQLKFAYIQISHHQFTPRGSFRCCVFLKSPQDSFFFGIFPKCVYSAKESIVCLRDSNSLVSGLDEQQTTTYRILKERTKKFESCTWQGNIKAQPQDLILLAESGETKQHIWIHFSLDGWWSWNDTRCWWKTPTGTWTWAMMTTVWRYDLPRSVGGKRSAVTARVWILVLNITEKRYPVGRIVWKIWK